MAHENDGHRARLRQRMLQEGLSAFQDHEILEMFLFQSSPRKDTNKLAHTLINNFGSLAGVLNASAEQLMSVKEVGEVTACNIALIKEIWLRCKRSEAERIRLDGMRSIVEYARRLLVECYTERLIVVYLDEGTNFLFREESTSNDSQCVQTSVKNIVSTALRVGAAGVVLFHCHVKGPCKPSDDDVIFTEKLTMALSGVNLVLLEHIIFNGYNEYYSFYSTGEIRKLQQKYKFTT